MRESNTPLPTSFPQNASQFNYGIQPDSVQTGVWVKLQFSSYENVTTD
jgi:hypothetical protein